MLAECFAQKKILFAPWNITALIEMLFTHQTSYPVTHLPVPAVPDTIFYSSLEKGSALFTQSIESRDSNSSIEGKQVLSGLGNERNN
jgi:hypothetical protein